ncbi:interferon-induced protein 44-like [Nematolebias whitei]|uniref:interferon-induced protein 44-like n=1 Tax=Nematolebias whitei TaxID=451745 RepID=UPI0018996769|nr:interferon-induced protein 44-like [Nematolebias whitei]
MAPGLATVFVMKEELQPAGRGYNQRIVVFLQLVPLERTRRLSGAMEMIFGLPAAATTSTSTTTISSPFSFSVAASKLPSQQKTTSATEKEEERRVEIPVFSGFQSNLDSPWRDVQWAAERRENLLKDVGSYRPSCKEVTQARVLLLGPVRSGKSSFISSVQSVFNGRVTNRAMVGSSFSTSFTKKLQSFNIQTQDELCNSGLVLCDIMGLGDGEMTGLTLHDILSVIKGHVPEGHKFSPDQPVGSETVGYVKMPKLRDKIHCVAFVVDASQVSTYYRNLGSTFKQLREHISDLGEQKAASSTQTCSCKELCLNQGSATFMIKRAISAPSMSKAGALLGMSTSSIVPVKNYSSELDPDVNTDVLLLSAVDHILQYTNLFFQDNAQQTSIQLPRVSGL